MFVGAVDALDAPLDLRILRRGEFAPFRDSLAAAGRDLVRLDENLTKTLAYLDLFAAHYEIRLDDEVRRRLMRAILAMCAVRAEVVPILSVVSPNATPARVQ